MRIKFEVLFGLNEKASLNRPAWTSTQETGMFEAHHHKHTNNGRIIKNYYYKKQ